MPKTLSSRGGLVAAAAFSVLVLAGIPMSRGPIQRYLDSREVARASAIVLDEISSDWRQPVRIHIGGPHVRAVVTRGQSESARPLSPDAMIALATLEKVIGRRSDARALQTIALADLARGQYARAVAGLERARTMAPTDVDVAVDLAAAYYVSRRPNDALRGLNITADELSRNPRNPALLYNYARLAGRVLTRAQIEDAWAAYRSVESNEAGNDVSLIDAPVVPKAWTPAFQAARDELVDRVLSQLASSCAESTGETAALKQRAWTLLADMEREHGAAVEMAASVRAMASPMPCRRNVQTAYGEFYNGLKFFRNEQFEKASVAFLHVEAIDMRDHPFAIEAKAYGTMAAYLSRSESAALDKLNDAVMAARAIGAFDALGRAERFRGYVLQDRGRFAPAQDAYREAVRAFSQSGDINSLATAHSLLADVTDSLGDYENGQRENETALGFLRLTTDWRARYNVVTWAQRVLMRDGLPHAAVLYARALASDPEVKASPIRGPRSLVDLAQLEIEAGDRTGASRALAEAIASGERIESQSSRLRFNASVRTMRARLAQGTPNAIEDLSAAMDAYRQVGSQISLARLALLRGRAYLAAGDRVRAAKDFDDGIVAFEKGRPAIGDARLRLSYFEEAWPLFEESIHLLVEDGQFGRALEVADRSRARELRPSVMPAASGSELARVRASLTDATRLVYYVALSDRLVIWVIGRDAVRHAVVPRSRKELDDTVTSFLRQLESDDPGAKQSSRTLYDAVLAPVESWIASATQLIVVPDPVLQPVPFAALRTPDGRYLVERRDVSLTPALRSFAAHAVVNSTLQSVLAVGDPASLGEDLPPLPSAREEAQDVSTLYPRREVLLAEAATKQRFLELLPQFEVLHFAGHAIVNPESPDLSRLVLAGRAGDDNVVFAHEIAALPLRGVRVAILAGCETASGRTYRSEGVVSWGSAFLAAGVPNVVATLWKIDDRTSRALFRSLHLAMRQGVTLSAAVRQAQLSMLQNADREARAPRTWASLTLIQAEN